MIVKMLSYIIDTTLRISWDGPNDVKMGICEPLRYAANVRNPLRRPQTFLIRGIFSCTKPQVRFTTLVSANQCMAACASHLC